jgi:hypothetical protein
VVRHLDGAPDHARPRDQTLFHEIREVWERAAAAFL